MSDVWQPLKEGQGHVRLNAVQYEQMRLAANVGVEEIGRRRKAQLAAKAKPTAQPVAPAAPAVSSNVTKDPDTGQLSYKGYPVAMAGGEPCVFGLDGWTKVSVFESVGGTADDLAAALSVVQIMPDGPSGKRFHAGPS